MSLTNPPDVITDINAKLTASSILPAGSTIWYPEAADTVAAPFFVLSATGRRTKVAEGILGFFSGEGTINAFVSGTIGQVETLANTICEALMADIGLLITDAEYDLASADANNDTTSRPREVTITFQIGLGA